MVLGIGVDVVAVGRIARSLTEGDRRFEELVFTPQERTACAARADRAQALAARFAAKEACLKALGTGVAQGLSLQQVEVIDGEGGRPELRLSGPAAERARALGVGRMHVSLSHELEVAAAVVVLES
jgi:holo-[acyl-carrier protein] synthase